MTDLIRDLPADDRPRERLLEHGAASLSDAELLAVLLGSGTRGMNAIQLARSLLRDGIAGLSTQAASAVVRIPGIGSAKAARLSAAFEISRRIATTSAARGERFDAEEFGRALVHTVAHERQERLGAAFLDARQTIRTRREIFVGTIHSALVSTREIVRYALEENAVGVVLYHNHPSGNPQPSSEDVLFTRKARQALALVDIELIDHFIAAGRSYSSMRAEGRL